LIFDGDVVKIGRESFKNCSDLKEIIIPDTVTNIQYLAFSNCSGLTNITIPVNMRDIESEAFYGCSNITSVIWNAEDCLNGGNFGSQVKSFTFGDEVKSIPTGCC
jgi:hypothetical protein